MMIRIYYYIVSLSIFRYVSMYKFQYNLINKHGISDTFNYPVCSITKSFRRKSFYEDFWTRINVFKVLKLCISKTMHYIYFSLLLINLLFEDYALHLFFASVNQFAFRRLCTTFIFRFC